MLLERPGGEMPPSQEPDPRSLESQEEKPEKRPEVTYKDPLSDNPEILSLYSETVSDTQNQLTVLREKIGIPQSDEIPPSLQTEIAALEKSDASSDQGTNPENTEGNDKQSQEEQNMAEKRRLLLEERLEKFINELQNTPRETLILYAQAPAFEAGTLFESEIFPQVSAPTLQEWVRIFLNDEVGAQQKMAEVDSLEDETALNEELSKEVTEAETPQAEDDIIEGEFTEVPDQLRIEDQRFRITDQSTTTPQN